GYHPDEPRRTAEGRHPPAGVGRHRIEDGVPRRAGRLGHRRGHGWRGRPPRPARAVLPQRRHRLVRGWRLLRRRGEADHLRRRLDPRHAAPAGGGDRPGSREAGCHPGRADHRAGRQRARRPRSHGRGRGHCGHRL
ncbi:MAG: RidA/YER057c/UK114 superfamily protein, partial [uncultured Cytophagales bacterium]